VELKAGGGVREWQQEPGLPPQRLQVAEDVGVCYGRLVEPRHHDRRVGVRGREQEVPVRLGLCGGGGDDAGPHAMVV